MKVGVLLICSIMLTAMSYAKDVEKEINALSNSPVDYATASKLFKISKSVQDEELRQIILKASAAAVLHANRGDVYLKHLKPNMNDSDAFESEFTEACPECNSTGLQDKKCQACKGNGRCNNPRCNGGRVAFQRIGGTSVSNCSRCRGSGRCRQCDGKCVYQARCSRCGGNKKIVNQNSLRSIYTNNMRIAAKWRQEKERLERERKEAEERAKAEAERLERERKEAEERAKAEAERLERERKEAEEKERLEAEAYERLRREMALLGLVDVRGKWMTPGSRRMVNFVVFQIVTPGLALCIDDYNRRFCLLYSAKDNPNLAEGDRLSNDLYRCGVYTYLTVNNASSTIAKYAIDLSVAMKEIKKAKE